MSKMLMPPVEAADNIPSTVAAMKSARRWLLWQSVCRPGKPKPDKVPFYVDGVPRGATETEGDIARLVTYDEARAAADLRGDGWHIGFALGRDGDGGRWQGIDFDEVEDNLLTGLAGALPGYVEISPSGKGYHAIGYGRTFRSLGSNKSGIEAYSEGRFFTFTGNVVRDAAVVCLAGHVENELASHHRALSPAALSNRVSRASDAVAVTHVSTRTVADLRSALNHLRSDGYSLWIEIGLALKTLGETGRGLWLDWSSTSTKYDPPDAARRWESFDPQYTGYQVVFTRAQEAGWNNPASNVTTGANFEARVNIEAAAGISAVPFIAPDILDVPPRPWVFGHWLLRGVVTTLIAPGGTGKSVLMVAAALSLATGRELLGKTVWRGHKRVWLWNLEDDRDELTRQLVACSLHHRIGECDYAGRLFVNDASLPLCLATKSRDGFALHIPIADAVAAEIRRLEIDVLIVDPFVSSHRADENDNGQVDAIAKLWASIAREAKCSIVLVHHSRKLAGQQVDAESSRGASALANAARSVLVVNRMEKSEAGRFGITAEERRSYIRVGNDKSNRAPAGKEDWFRIVSIKLANRSPESGDSVGVIEQWTPPDTSAETRGDDTLRARVQAKVSDGEWRFHHTAKDWIGCAVAEVMGVDLSSRADKRRVTELLTHMLSRGELKIENRLDRNRHLRDFVMIGEAIEFSCDSPAW